MRRRLSLVASVLVGANLLAFPNTLSAFSDAASNGKASAESEAGCACDGSTSGSRPSDGVAMASIRTVAIRANQVLRIPARCPIEGCTVETWWWYFCLKEPDQSCDWWRHGYTVYFCPGVTYFNCNGFTWEDTNESCSGCTSTTLPSGCTPLNPPYVYCMR